MKNEQVSLGRIPSSIAIIMYILSGTFFIMQYVIGGVLTSNHIDYSSFAELVWLAILLSTGLYAISVLSSWLPLFVVYPIVAIQVLWIGWKIFSYLRRR